MLEQGGGAADTRWKEEPAAPPPASGSEQTVTITLARRPIPSTSGEVVPVVWPTGPWIIWITRDGRLLVTARGEQQPESSAFPVGDAETEARALARRLLVGHLTDWDAVMVEGFDGTIGGAVAVQEQLRARTPRRG